MLPVLRSSTYDPTPDESRWCRSGRLRLAGRPSFRGLIDAGRFHARDADRPVARLKGAPPHGQAGAIFSAGCLILLRVPRMLDRLTSGSAAEVVVEWLHGYFPDHGRHDTRPAAEPPRPLPGRYLAVCQPRTCHRHAG